MLRKLGLIALALMVSGASALAEETAEGKSLYERLGGEPAIRAVVDEFTTIAAADPKVNFTRKGTPKEWQATDENVAKFKEHMVQFVAVATGATDKVYEGKDMKTTHEGMQITDAEFDALAADLKAALQKLNVPEAEQKELLDIVGTTRGQIVEK